MSTSAITVVKPIIANIVIYGVSNILNKLNKKVRGKNIIIT